MDQSERGRRFEELHQGATFVIPNPWDAGIARVLEALGFEALATTSSGLAFSFGQPDGTVREDEVVEHVRRLTEATELPLSVDLEEGYGAAPEQAARAIEAVAAVGAVGGSIEDFDRDQRRLYEPAEAAERIAAAAEAAARLPFRFMLTARAENHLRGNPDLDDTITRLQAYEAAGADVVFAPGLRELDDVRAVAEATERPLNVLATPTMSVEEIAAAGGRRVSLGGLLAWATVEAMAEVAVRIRDDGDLSVLRPGTRVARWLGGD
ncbi:MAG: isocitrate lyase/phosphoenolpyruvate mutase family protein [Solirubrobacterales bacterium]